LQVGDKKVRVFIVNAEAPIAEIFEETWGILENIKI